MTASRIEQLRASYRPTSIRVLFVGESPPAGDTFFYNCQAWSNLGRYTLDGFVPCYPAADIRKDCSRFLDFFRDRGCYLDDLCLSPVNGLTAVERKQQRTEGVGALAERIRQMREPVLALVIVMKAIEGHVRRAVAKTSSATAPCFTLPFPAFGHQQKYVVELGKVMCELRHKGILRDP